MVSSHSFLRVAAYAYDAICICFRDTLACAVETCLETCSPTANFDNLLLNTIISRERVQHVVGCML